MQEDWDTLVILDGCRYDLFAEHNTIPGELERIESNATMTPVWIRKNLSSVPPGTVLVNANPQLSSRMLKEREIENPFDDVVDAWDFAWDSELGTVPPDKVTDLAIKMAEKYPDKRMVVFYLQPHHPFIGDKQVEWDGKHVEGSEGEQRNAWLSGWKNNLSTDKPHHVWKALEHGKIGSSEAMEAYGKNLDLVLREVSRLLDHLSGITVITSDHGNSVGEWFLYGHPNVKMPSILNVPKLRVKNE